jgi:hypothetical protein
MSNLLETIFAFCLVGMSVMDALVAKFSGRQAAEEAQRQRRLAQWEQAVVRLVDDAGSPDDLHSLAMQLGFDLRIVKSDVAEVVKRREMGHHAAKLPDAERRVRESDQRVETARQALAAAQAELDRALAVERDVRHFAEMEVQQGRKAAEHIQATSTAVLGARADLLALERDAGPIAQRKPGLELSIAEARQRILQVQHVRSVESSLVQAKCRDAIAAGEKQLKADARVLVDLDKRIAQAREALADAEAAAIQRAIAGELAAPVAQVAEQVGGVRNVTVGL